MNTPAFGSTFMEEGDAAGYVAPGDPSLRHTATGRALAEVSRCAEEFKYLHVPGSPVFVVNIHDFVTAAIAAERPEVKALCIDLPTIKYLTAAPNTPYKWLTDVGKYFVGNIAGIAQRSGKLLTVDMDI